MANTYVETEIFEAQMDEDFERRDDLLDDFLPSELKTFARQLDDLRDAVLDTIRHMGSR